MYIGFCTGLDRIASAPARGFDYLEPSLNSLRGYSWNEIKGFASELAEYGLRVGSFNCSLPGCDVTGAVPMAEPMSFYLEDVIKKAAYLGTRVVVLGSGGARRIHEGIDRQLQLDRFTDFLRLYSHIAAEYGISIAIEPLNKNETNYINTVAEGFELAVQSGLENVGVLADYYHMCVENEGIEVLERVKGKLLHMHIANPEGRVYPAEGDGVDYPALFAMLKKIGYEGGISVEARGDYETQALASVEFLKKFLVRV